jgi:anti-anti-sigma factor
LDLETAPRLESQLDELIDGGAALVVLQLGEVEFLDSSGMRTIVGAARRLGDGGGKLLLADVSGAALQVLEIAGVLHDLVGTVEDHRE